LFSPTPENFKKFVHIEVLGKRCSSLVYEVINKVLKASLSWIGGPCSSFAILPDFDFPDFWLIFRFIIIRLSLSLTRINGIII